jgi:hypothetical protein
MTISPKTKFKKLIPWILKKGLKYYIKNFPENFKKVKHLKIYQDFTKKLKDSPK